MADVWHVNGMSSLSHLPQCRVQSPGDINVSHDRSTLQGVRIPTAILKIVFRHILFFVFNAV